MTVRLEHANITVTSPKATAAWMQDVFGWTIRWQGEADQRMATACTWAKPTATWPSTARQSHWPRPHPAMVINGGLNHIAVVVDDLDAVETRVRAAGFTPGEHHDYEPGRRFYFRDRDNIEFEVVEYDA